jgi:hypothetical protein
MLRVPARLGLSACVDSKAGRPPMHRLRPRLSAKLCVINVINGYMDVIDGVSGDEGVINGYSVRLITFGTAHVLVDS